LCIDHPGVGDSRSPSDPWSLTPDVVADADAAFVAKLRARYPGRAIGVGHSMGSTLTVLAQARRSCYDALGLLGWSHTDRHELAALAPYLSEQERAIIGDRAAIEAQVVALAKARFSIPLPKGDTGSSELLLAGMPVTDAGLAAMDGCRSGLLAVCGLAAILGGIGQEVAQIDVPVFVGVGERDITGDPRPTAEALKGCHDITLYTLAGAGHLHNIAPNRIDLWDRLAAWIEGVA
jgi:pimeloyl-ACP methyl ester carboxylesterase